MKQFKKAQVISRNAINGMAWSCAPNKSVWQAEQFCKAH